MCVFAASGVHPHSFALCCMILQSLEYVMLQLRYGLYAKCEKDECSILHTPVFPSTHWRISVRLILKFYQIYLSIDVIKGYWLAI